MRQHSGDAGRYASAVGRACAALIRRDGSVIELTAIDQPAFAAQEHPKSASTQTVAGHGPGHESAAAVQTDPWPE
jgi:hypothetical protein